MKLNPNDAAFPLRYEFSEGGEDHVAIHHGLTIRAHFAAMALQGFLASPDQFSAKREDCDEQGVPVHHYAKMSVKYADALIAELSKGNP